VVAPALTAVPVRRAGRGIGGAVSRAHDPADARSRRRRPRCYARAVGDENRQILHEILGRGDGFGHRQHVELAWRSLAVQSPAEAADAVVEAIRQVAAAHGQEGKFHETITRSWVQCVAVHCQRWPAATFEAFLGRNPQLLDPSLLGHYYSPGLLGSQEARDRWVSPDRRALPALAS
jgi:hypothetical protein